MTGSPPQASPDAAPGKSVTDFRAFGRGVKWATVVFLLVSIAILGLSWLSGLVKFD